MFNKILKKYQYKVKLSWPILTSKIELKTGLFL
jgi:hypothetical protein